MEERGLISAMLLDGQGGGSYFNWQQVQNWQPAEGLLWLHLDYRQPQAAEWLKQRAGLDPLVARALCAEENRPRLLSTPQGQLITLRGVNLNPGAEPDDMISIRIWIEPRRIITTRHRCLMAVRDLRDTIDAGQGPTDPGSFFTQFCRLLTLRMNDSIANIDDLVGELEDEIFDNDFDRLRAELPPLRRQVIRLRRYLAPQRDLLHLLAAEKLPWLETDDHVHLREVADRVTHYVEDLDSARDRANVIQGALESHQNERMNKTIYLLAIITTIFLPLGLLTGLLGINVGGIPGADEPHAFFYVCLILGGLAALLTLFFRRLRWL